MPKPKLLNDSDYYEELDRMRMMKRFAEMPAAKQELIRALRKITETDKSFLHNLITFFIDNCEKCPTPRELYERAGLMREAMRGPLGNADCPDCHGTGWIQTVRTVRLPGMEPYEADCSQRCTCAPPVKSDAA
jgi:hypothetical protein